MSNIEACYTDRFVAAVTFATGKHAAQRRKHGGLPYVTHLWAVTENAWTAGASEDVAIACLLHDTVEDCGGEPVAREIGERFGAYVLSLVLAATDSTSSDPSVKLPWGERKLAHIAHLLDASPDVALVVAADKLHNVETMVASVRADGPGVFDAFKGGADGTIWYFEQIRAALADRFPTAFVARWDAALAELTEAAARSVSAGTRDAIRARLWSHLVGRHACMVARDTDLGELVVIHDHEHDGPGTIRNHPRTDLASDPHRVASVLAEAADSPVM